ncbi:MAG: hypothetical protein IJZ29_03065 [Clostridia bacterium]|nr:hypothetical protein [Clostridia bacterium]
MQYYWRIWLWKDGKKSTELTEFMTVPFFHEGCLNQTINTAEVILDCMAIETKKAFPPKTKFRIERYTTQDFSDIPKIFDLVVQDDNVEEYVGCPEICCHRIDLISPSVIAQGMHVDNISLTYELQDATLNYKTTRSDNTPVSVSIVNGGSEQPIRETEAFTWPVRLEGGGIGGGTVIV